jgi:hypothetical protein
LYMALGAGDMHPPSAPRTAALTSDSRTSGGATDGGTASSPAYQRDVDETGAVEERRLLW